MQTPWFPIPREARGVRCPTLGAKRCFIGAEILSYPWLNCIPCLPSNGTLLEGLLSYIAPVRANKATLTSSLFQRHTYHGSLEWNRNKNKTSFLEGTLQFLPNMNPNSIATRDGELEGSIGTNCNRCTLTYAIDISSTNNVAICPCWQR